MEKIRLILGTMNFGPQVDECNSLKMLNHFLGLGFHEIDTAYVYNGGDTDRILGAILDKAIDDQISIATKVHPRISGKLDADAVEFQFHESLKSMKRDAVDVLYFHFPDRYTPIESALKATNELYKQGKIKEFGLSNYPAWLVVDIWHYCKEHGLIAPTIYQGMYNGLSRNVETELFPAIRKLGMRFYAFNPLAGGLLTGKHLNFDETPQAGRFSRLKSYRDRYWKRSFFDTVNFLSQECREVGIKPAEAAFRWLVHHSKLSAEDGDGIIIGASSIEQLEQNTVSVQQGVLLERIIKAFDIAWNEAKPESPDYFKFFPIEE